MKKSDKTLFLLFHTVKEWTDGSLHRTQFTDHTGEYRYTIFYATEFYTDNSHSAYKLPAYTWNAQFDYCGLPLDYIIECRTKKEAIGWCVKHWLQNSSYD